MINGEKKVKHYNDHESLNKAHDRVVGQNGGGRKTG